MSKVAIANGENRKENIIKAINLIKKDIGSAIKTKKKDTLFIKINAIDINIPLACTHVEALDAVLEVFYDKFKEIIIGDNSFAFTKYNGGPYRKILNKYKKIKFSDLSEFDSEKVFFEKINAEKIIGEISILQKKTFSISLALPKTHDTFVYTGCLKNMVGCVIKNRSSIHALNRYERLFLRRFIESNKAKWNNLFKVIEETRPDLCILDGYYGMEGDGRLLGSKVKLGIAMCSLDGVALDKLAAKICGFDYVPYLELFPPKNIEIIKEGFEDIKEINRRFKQHYNLKHQITMNSSAPFLDLMPVFSELKRPYRIKDRIMEMIRK